jgi:hypothetical protein
MMMVVDLFKVKLLRVSEYQVNYISLT